MFSWNPYNKPEAGGLTTSVLQIRKMWLRPKADCLQTLTLPTVQLCLLERKLLLLWSPESKPSCLLIWGYANISPKVHKPCFLKIQKAGAGCQLRISSRWESQGSEGLHICNITHQATSIVGPHICLVQQWASPCLDSLGFSTTPTREGVSWPSQRNQSPTRVGKDLSQGAPQDRRARWWNSVPIS